MKNRGGNDETVTSGRRKVQRPPDPWEDSHWIPAERRNLEAVNGMKTALVVNSLTHLKVLLERMLVSV